MQRKMTRSKEYLVALLPSYPEIALPYLANKLRSFPFVKSIRSWGGCLIVKSTSPVEFAERCRRVTGIEVISVGHIVEGFKNATKLLKKEASKNVFQAKSYRVSIIKHSRNNFEVDEEESMHLTGLIIDEMKKAGSLPKDREAELVLRLLSFGREYMIPRLSYQGMGGLPAGINGKVVCLVSGGAGSLVAAMEVAKAGFTPLPLLIVDSVDENEFRRAVISSCFLTELTLEKMDMYLVTLGKKAENKAAIYEDSLRAAESEAKKIGTDYICTGIHICPELPLLLGVSSSSSCKVINPVVTWDRQRLLSSMPEELSRRFMYEKPRLYSESRLAGKKQVIRFPLSDLTHYNEALDIAIKSLKEGR